MPKDKKEKTKDDTKKDKKIKSAKDDSSRKGKRKNPFEEVRDRPETFIGSVETINKETFVHTEKDEDVIEQEESEKDEDENDEGEKEDKADKLKATFVLKLVKYNSGLIHIFVEIKSNAVDNKWESIRQKRKMTGIWFTFDVDTGRITVRNDGAHIPVEKTEYEYNDHRTGETIKEVMYPAEMFFGDMFAGTNFEDTGKRKKSGRNGIGAKAANVMSTEFTVTCADPDNKLMFTQTFSNNGQTRTKPKITKYKKKTGYTEISFIPDYKRFGYPGLDEDLISILKRHIYEAAMITGLPVYCNGEKIIIKNLQTYARLYYPNVKDNKAISFKSPKGDECVLVEIDSMDAVSKDINHISFINGKDTERGGVHVEAWKNSIFPALLKAINNRKKKDLVKATAKDIYPYFMMFVRCEAYDPKFADQMKTEMAAPEINIFGKDKASRKEMNDKISASVKKMLKWNFIGLLDDKLSLKNELKEGKKEKVSRKINYKDDANNAGKYENECTLFICEGESAKGFALNYIAKTKTRDTRGAFAIKGKFLNVENAPIQKIRANKEIRMLMKVLGLKSGVDYSDKNNLKTLRYKYIMIMADQDDDGIHIRGLLCNFIYRLWPSLYDKLFVKSFQTVVVLARKGKKDKEPLMFFSIPDYEKWRSKKDEKEIKRYNIKHYKGLGTHDLKDVGLYSKDPKIITHILDGKEKALMNLGFSDKNIPQRKQWITKDMVTEESGEMKQYSENMVVEGEYPLSEFVDKDLIIYHRMVLSRALPNIYDGFKISGRKTFYGLSTHPQTKKGSIKVAIAVGSIMEKTAYHHGPAALEATIIKMAQGYVGSNNIPLLVNDGNFGSRREGGKDAASGRYTFTKPEDITKVIFDEKDEPLLEQVEDEGEKVEYKFYMPIIPMILVNGAEGIACGFSTSIASYNVKDLIKWIRAWLKLKDEEDTPKIILIPYFRGFEGKIDIIKVENKTTGVTVTKWISEGILERESPKSRWWNITEAPVGLWTGKLQQHIEYLSTGEPAPGTKAKKCKVVIEDKQYNSTANTVNIRFKVKKDFEPNIDTNFKILRSSDSLMNMYAVDGNFYPTKYPSAEAIIHKFCKVRLEYYRKRREYWIGEWEKDLVKANNRYLFIKYITEDKLVVSKRKKDELEEDMQKLKLVKIDDSYEYLTSMPIISLTKEKMASLKKEIDRIQSMIDDYKNSTEKELWLRDLDNFEKEYDKFLETRNDDIVFDDEDDKGKKKKKSTKKDKK